MNRLLQVPVKLFEYQTIGTGSIISELKKVSLFKLKITAGHICISGSAESNRGEKQKVVENST